MSDKSVDHLLVWDKEAALARLRGKVDRLTALVKLFITELVMYKEGLVKAVQSGDFVQVKQEAHTIKGAVGNVGGLRLQAKAVEIEKAAMNEDLESVQTLLPGCEQAIDELKERFEAWLQEQGG